MRRWYNRNPGVTHVAMNELLAILGSNSFENLPKDARTLLKTPTTSAVIPLIQGSYVHVGIATSILKQMPLIIPFITSDVISIDISIDGLPISKSSTVAFWPILGLVKNNGCKAPPFLIGIFQGDAKPTSAPEFLSQFVDEYCLLQRQLFEYKEKKYHIKIRAFVCDAPATAFIKGIKGHTGYFGCGKCLTEGTFLNNRTCFPDTEIELRTDESFATRLQEEHHKSISALEDAGIGMVSQFPLDYLHLVCLGIMKKIIELWLSKGPLSVRLSKRQCTIINERLVLIENSRPSEINRSTLNIEMYKMWKGTNFRSFVLYIGAVCLKDVLKDEVYSNFNFNLIL